MPIRVKPAGTIRHGQSRYSSIVAIARLDEAALRGFVAELPGDFRYAVWGRADDVERAGYRKARQTSELTHGKDDVRWNGRGSSKARPGRPSFRVPP